jgi:2-haloacid dehalogenase
MNFDQFKFITFDCYGTLIDWESGILACLRPILHRYNVRITDDEILDLYSRFETTAEAGPYQKYRSLLENVVSNFGMRFGFTPEKDEQRSLPESIQSWLPFPDSVLALKRLKERFSLGVISNIDDDLFRPTARLLEVEFDVVVTAEQVAAYKPSHRVFITAQERMGIERSAWLHVANGRTYDIQPAQQLGIANVWVDRQTGHNIGASAKDGIQPELVVKDLNELLTRALGALELTNPKLI